MKLTDIKNGNLSAEWAEKGYELPKFDVEAVKAKTHAEPTWVHFGAGNIFRAFPAAILNDALNSGKYDRGVIVAESFDYEIIDKAYRPYDNLSLLVCLKSTGDIEKKVMASVTESLKADHSFGEDWARLVEIFQNPSLQMISFTITEKGYGVAPADLERGLTPVLAMGKVTALLYERFKAGKLPLTVQSMDNCSHNGDKVKNAVIAYASKWVEQGLIPAEFLAYVQGRDQDHLPLEHDRQDHSRARMPRFRRCWPTTALRTTTPSSPRSTPSPLPSSTPRRPSTCASRTTTPMAVLRWSWAVSCTATARPSIRSRR